MSMDFENITKEQLYDMPNSKRLEYAWHWQIMQEKGVQLEWLDDDQWKPLSGTTVYTFNIYRIKPQPKMVPLNFNDQLVGVVVVNRRWGNRYIVVAQDAEKVYIHGVGYSYEELQQKFTRLDGSRFEKSNNGTEPKES